MTLRFLSIVAISTALLLSGCESQEQPASKTAPHQVVKPDKPIETEEIAKAAETVKEEVVKAVEEAVKETEQKTEEVIKEATEIAKETVNTVEEKAVTLKEEVASAVAIPEVSGKASGPEEVVFKASYGNVTLPHAMHADAYDCSNCHGDAAPAAITLGKEAAHKLCKGCHKDEGAGPTGCKGCHEK